MSEEITKAVIGFAGLGNMGTPMAHRLVEAGWQVMGFDPVAAARDRLAEAGGQAVENVAALGEADVVILMLPNSAVVRAVLFDDGLAEALDSGAMVIDMSSSEPLRTREIAAQLAERGVRLVDAPVSGGVKGAVNGTLTIMVGGDEDDVARATPLFRVMGKPRRVGPVGAGHALKALNNLMSATHLWITSEAILAGEAFGLDPAVMLEAVNGSSGRSGSTDNKWPNFILPGTYDSGFGLRLMLKDMRIAIDLAQQLGWSSVLGEAAVDRWQQAAEDLPQDADHTRVAAWLREHHDAGPSATAND
jgi:3-hydroxyisobutyrate dehydrogenase